MTQDSARNFKGIAEVTQKLPYEAEAPSYIPFGYQLYTARLDRNDVLEVVYYKRNAPHLSGWGKILLPMLWPIEWAIPWIP